MGVAFCMSPCFICKQAFSYNPVAVPSFRDPKTNIKEPVCESCMAVVNNKRKSLGLEPHSIRPDAYTYCNEEEI